MAYGIIGLLIGLIVGHLHGWVTAHLMVAAECEKLGKFFVRGKVFQCTLIGEKEES